MTYCGRWPDPPLSPGAVGGQDLANAGRGTRSNAGRGTRSNQEENMSKRIMGAVLAAVFAAATFGLATLGVAAANAGAAVMATGDPNDPPAPCPDPGLECDEDYGWTQPGT